MLLNSFKEDLREKAERSAAGEQQSLFPIVV